MCKWAVEFVIRFAQTRIRTKIVRNSVVEREQRDMHEVEPRTMQVLSNNCNPSTRRLVLKQETMAKRTEIQKLPVV